MLLRALCSAALLTAGAAHADPLTLTLADPQPQASDLTPGLAVSYAYPGDVRMLEDAHDALRKGRAGPPLRGLSYYSEEGEIALTSKSAKKIAAAISGYMRFDEAGTYTLNVYSNDGIELSLGGQQVAFYDGIHACEPSGEQEVIVPEAGWYALEATYFQRKGGACLEMEWISGASDSGGRSSVVPDEVFAFSE